MKTTKAFALSVFVLFVFSACGGEEFKDTPIPSGTGGTAGQAGTGGAGGTAATGGSAGSSGEGGTGGSSGAGGGAGDAGVDSDAPDSAGGSSGTGGVAGSSGSGGDAGPDADADTPDGPNEADAPDPCTVPATADEISAMLSIPCAPNFGAKCGTSNSVKRSDFVVAVDGQVPASQFEGYTFTAVNLPTQAPYMDVPLTHPALLPVHRAKWLNVIEKTPNFFPDDPTLKCWAQDVVDRMEGLPLVYAVPYYFVTSQTVTPGSGPNSSVHYSVYHANSAHKIESAAVNNNMGASTDFSTPEPTTAVDTIRVRCSSDGTTFKDYSEPMSSGRATFASMDCYHSTGGILDFWVQFYAATNPPSGAQCRFALDPTSIDVRGEVSEVPTFTVN